MRRFDAVVVGAGPVGLAAALARSARDRVLLLVDRPPNPNGLRGGRVEALPLSSLGILDDLGVAPPEIGVIAIDPARRIAWERAAPEDLHGPPVAHVERALLSAALWRRVMRRPQIEVRIARAPAARAEGDWRPGDPDIPLRIDATGRRAASALARVGPTPPWAARLWSVRGGADPALAVAAFRDGYVYRLGTAHALTVGAVVPCARLPRDLGTLKTRLAIDEAAWILDDLPAGEPNVIGSWMASVQWPGEPPSAGLVRIGDAALARDALSSQGLAAGLSDALYAAAADPSTAPLVARREGNERAHHVASLERFVARCRWCAAPAWARYHAWLSAMGAPTTPESPDVVALRGGAVVAL